MTTDLTDLATTRWWKRQLTHAERRLVEHTARGETLDLRADNPDPNTVERARKWDDGRVIRARVLEVLALGERDDWPVRSRGIRLRGAHICDHLNLDFGTVPQALIFENCVFDEPITMRYAKLKALAMTGTRVPGLDAEGVDVSGYIFLKDGFVATGEVRLLGARIGQNINCEGAEFSNPSAYALNADGLDVTGALFLRYGFTALGEVRLLGARIGGTLECSRGSFTNVCGYAFNADRINVTGTVYLDDGFKATGEVRLPGAHIDSQLSCRGGSFIRPGGTALNGRGLHVAEEWLFTPKSVCGEIDVRGADVNLLVDNAEAWPDGWEGDGLKYQDFSRNAPTDIKTRMDWLARQGGTFRPGPYSHLAAVYRRRGDPEAARKVLVQRERRRTHELSGWRRQLYRGWGVVSAYGYQPSRAIAALLALIMLGGVVFTVAPMERLVNAPLPFLSGLYAIELAIPLINLGLAADWQPTAGWAVGWMWFTIAVGWFLSGAFLAAITGIFKPDE